MYGRVLDLEFAHTAHPPTMTSSLPPPPNKHHGRARNNITFNRTHNCSLMYSVIIFLSVRVRPLTATQVPFVPSSSVATSSRSLPQQADGPFSAAIIDKFLTNRCGTCNPGESPALWSYGGTLTDPTTGKVVADVEGLELIKRLPVVQRSQLMNDNEQSILDNLHAKIILSSESNAIPQWDTAMTILSRRLFCYRRKNSRRTCPETHSSPSNSLLTSLRLRPDGPLRYLPSSDSMAIYDSAVTYISRNNGREMVILSERGGCGGNPEDVCNIELKKQFVMGNAQINTTNKKSPHSLFDFSILARRGNERDPTILPLITSEQVDSVDVTIPPPRSRFLQFGKGDGNANLLDRKYGSVRETYSYEFNNDFASADDSSSANDIFVRIFNKFGMLRPRAKPFAPKTRCTVIYTRYGEAPPWYAPGRSCTLELRGELINIPAAVDLADGDVAADSLTSSSNLPTLPLWAASKCNFWSGWPALFSCRKRTADSLDLVRQYYQLPLESDVALARKAVELFCRERNLKFDEKGNDYPLPERSRWLVSTENALYKVHVVIQRLSKSLLM